MLVQNSCSLLLFQNNKLFVFFIYIECVDGLLVVGMWVTITLVAKFQIACPRMLLTCALFVAFLYPLLFPLVSVCVWNNTVAYLLAETWPRIISVTAFHTQSLHWKLSPICVFLVCLLLLRDCNRDMFNGATSFVFCYVQECEPQFPIRSYWKSVHWHA